MILGSNYVYYDVTKTGSRTLYDLLTKYYSGKPVRRAKTTDRFQFASVRDPYDRVCSLWWSTCKRDHDIYGFRRHGDTLPNFIEWLISGPKVSRGADLVLTQSYQLRKFKIDYLIRYESFTEDIIKLPFYKGHKISHLNRSDRPLTSDLLCRDSIMLINMWCEDDFTIFSYPKLS